MIGKLIGVVDEIYENHIILNLSGVGYIVHTTKRLLQDITIDQKLTLYIEQHIYENTIKLYGFESKEEQQILRLLIKVNGINYKTAINLIDIVGINKLITAIQQKDDQSLRVKGIGEKTAKKIVIELNDDFLKLSTNFQPSYTSNINYTESISALINLGFDPKSCKEVVNNIINNNDKISVNDIIVLALKEL
jgi:Holliday junction DNA helicase RuvA